jgi:AI-2 transport protein TqsA
VNTGERWLFNFAALVVVIAGIKTASPIIVTLLVALFVALVCAPLSIGMQRRGVPTVVAVLIVLTLLLSLIAGLSAVVGGSVNAFREAIPTYEARLAEQMQSLWILAASYDIPVDTDQIRQSLNTSGIFSMLSNLLAALGGLLTNGFLILLIVVFILMEAASMPEKVRVAFQRDEREPFLAFAQFMTHLNKYLAIKTLVSAATGVIAALWLLYLGVDFPLVLGLLAFLLNYIPTLGSIIAAVPAVILAFMQFGPGMAGITALGYVAMNVGLGNVLEPRLQGRGLGLSPMVVFLSLIFWGWLLGLVGILLAIPLTMTAKLAFEETPRYQWLAILLGPERPARKASNPSD